MRKNLIHAVIIAIFVMGAYFIARRCLADYHYRRALEMEENTEQNGAIDAYRKAIDLDPTNAEYRSQLARLYLRRARLAPRQPSTDFLNLAEQSYEKAIQLSPQNGNYWLDLGMVYERLGKLKGAALAASCFEKAISRDPNNAFYRTVLGSFYIRNGRKEEGLKEYERAVASVPKVHLYDFLKGKEVRDEFLDAAINGLKKAVELYPKDTNIYHQLGTLYIKKGMYAEAIEQYEYALKLKPGHEGFKRTLESLKKQTQATQVALPR